MPKTNTDLADGAPISWPAFIKLKDDNGLVYITDQQQWLNDSELHAAHYETEDRLIDSDGKVFSPNKRSLKENLPLSTGLICELADAVGYVQAYAAEENFCCSAKIQAKNIAEILTMIYDIGENS